MPEIPHIPSSRRATRVVLIGYGTVGARFVEGLVPAVIAGHIDLTVVGAEDHDAYNRVLLAEYAVGRADRARLDMTDTQAAIDAGVAIRLGEAVTFVDRTRQQLRLDSGDTLGYDRLVFATGARANIPSLEGLETARRDRRSIAAAPHSLDHGAAPLPAGVVALRDLADANTVLAAVQAGQRIVVLGAGVLGMEIALAATEHGATVIAVHHGDTPMARQLDIGGGRALSRAAHSAGVTMAAHSRAEGLLFRTGDDGQPHFDALFCADGKQIAGDLLLLSCGVGARTELAARADLAVSTGILVDEELRSWSDPDVFAIGDCAHIAARGSELADGRVPGSPSGLVGPGWRQADWLAARLAAEAVEASSPRRLTDTLPVENRAQVVMLKAEGIDVVAGGNIAHDLWDSSDALQSTVWADPARGTYVKMTTSDGVLEGFVAVGLPRTGAELTLLFERRGELPADRSALLRLDAADSGALSTADPNAPDATVCWCNGVSVQHIHDAAATGAATVEEVGKCTRAGTGCGTCKGRIAEVLAGSAASTVAS